MPIHRQYRFPVDPECEVVADYAESLSLDVTAIGFGQGDEPWAAFEWLHRGECERCALYGVEYMSMPEPVGFSVISSG